MPYYPPEKESKAFFRNTTQGEKIVQEYTGIDFLRLEDIGIFVYWRFLHDAIIWNHSLDPEDKYLENAYNYQQEKPDRAGLRELMGERVVKKHGK